MLKLSNSAQMHFSWKKTTKIARKLISKLLDEDVQMLLLRNRLGLIYIRSKRWKEARTVFFDYWNNVDQRCAYAWRYLGMSTWKLRDIDGAEKAFEISNLLDNSNPETWGLLSVIWLIIGVGQNRAFQCYQRALKLGIDNFEIFSELGYLFSKAHNLEDDAEYWYDKALTLDNTRDDLWIQYAELTYSRGNLEKSIEWYEIALQHIKGDVKHGEVEEKLKLIKDEKLAIDQEVKF
jgi:tetratricopeptide (TPR) repeat protein